MTASCFHEAIAVPNVTRSAPGSRASRTSTNTGIANSPNSTADRTNRVSTGMSKKKISSPTNTVPQYPIPVPRPDSFPRVAGVLTKSKTASAPVEWCRARLQHGMARALVVNSGNANAFTGKRGREAVKLTAEAAAVAADCLEADVYLASTGVIGEPLDAGKFAHLLDGLARAAAPGAFEVGARAIMTTDTYPKLATRSVEIGGTAVTINGFCKGAGMIAPDMATMLCFVFTDADIPQPVLQSLLSQHVKTTFNCMTVDGDTSTNDSFVVVSTGRGPVASRKDLGVLEEAITGVARELAQAIVRDAEGATKFVTVRVERGASTAECRRVAYAIAHSPLVKTAFFASDPNLGRILAAIGYAGVPLDTGKVDLYIDEVAVARRGGRHPGYAEADALAAMKKPEFTVRAVLNRGKAAATVWTCDFSFDYVKINAEYRT